MKILETVEWNYPRTEKKKKDFRNLWWDLFEYSYEYWDTHMSRAYSTPDEGRSTGRELKDNFQGRQDWELFKFSSGNITDVL